MDVASFIVSTVVGIATVALAYLNWRLVRATDETVKAATKTVEASREQVRIGQEQLRAQQRPVLVPVAKPIFQEGHDNWLDWGVNEQSLEFHNLGTGAAFNIAVVLYGCASYRHDGPAGVQLDTTPSGHHWTCWLGEPFAPNERAPVILKLGNGIFLDGNKQIGAYPLNAPDEEIPGATSKPGVLWRIARCTITYRDISGRKYASIFDYVHNRGWHMEAILPDIDRDLHDLEGYHRAAPTLATGM